MVKKPNTSVQDRPVSKAGANQAITWGELFVMLDRLGEDHLAKACMEKILSLDAA